MPEQLILDRPEAVVSEKNVRVMSGGMGFPRGAVVTRKAFQAVADHLEIGSLVETDDPITHGHELAGLSAKPAGASAAEAENTKLRQQLIDLSARHAAEVATRKAAEAENTKLRQDLAAAEDLVKQLNEQNGLLAGARRQEQIDRSK